MTRLFTFLPMLFCIHANAETERFDMALSGDFSKDFCQLSFMTEQNHDLDPERPAFGYNNLIGQNVVALKEVSLEYTCSAGNYDITFSTLNNSDHKFIPGARASYHLTMYASGYGDGSGDSSAAFFDASNPRTNSFTDDGDNNPGGAILFTMYYRIVEEEKHLLPDSYNYTEPFTMTIDRR